MTCSLFKQLFFKFLVINLLKDFLSQNLYLIYIPNLTIST